MARGIPVPRVLLASPCPSGLDLFASTQDDLKPLELHYLGDKGQSPRGVVTVEATSEIAQGVSSAVPALWQYRSAGYPQWYPAGEGAAPVPSMRQLAWSSVPHLYQVAEFSGGSVFSSPALKDVEILKCLLRQANGLAQGGRDC